MGGAARDSNDTSSRTNGWRRLALLFALLWAVFAALWVRDRIEALPGAEVVVEAPTPAGDDRLVVTADSFDRLPGWDVDRLSESLEALQRSCRATVGMPADKALGEAGFAGTVADWIAPCEALQELGSEASDADVRKVIEARFRPHKLSNGDRRIGLFTGYYEPLLRGSRTRSEEFASPLYKLPPDLVSIDLGRFRDDLKGRRIGGVFRGDRLEPYPDRAGIDAGALAGRDLEILWVDDPVDAFFLHIQGSGRVELAEGGEMRVGYAGQNGQPYFAIGRELIANGALSRREVSMQSIRRWLEENPDQADELMAMNRSFVFFRELGEDGPIGAQGVVLTPARSLAVDRRYLPLGAPVWLESRLPAGEDGAPDRTRRWLLVTQDTGGAIRGPVRGDVFWGAGEAAEAVAGRMKHRGRMWILLPREVAVSAAES